MHNEFQNRVVIVTGGANGIGAAVARRFGGRGAHVVIIDLDKKHGERIASSVCDSGGSAYFICADVSDDVAMRRAVEHAVSKYNRLDVVHANAGIEFDKNIVDTTAEEWRRVIDINLTGAFLVCRYAMMEMMKQHSGAIVITSSVIAQVTGAGLAAYGASKGGINALVRSLAIEGAPFNVRANAILPGAIDTPMLRREAAIIVADFARQTELFAAMQPLNRIGTPDEVAEAALFLASDAASFITGTTLAVDGGALASLPSGPSLSFAG